MQKAQNIRKRKEDIKSIKYGNIVEPDPKGGVVEIDDTQEEDPEVIDDERNES
jgi:hypothetical protein